MLNVWKKFLTLEAAFPTLFYKKGPTPELSAQFGCGIPEVAGNQTERFGGRQVEKRAWPILLSLRITNPSLKKLLTPERTRYKARWRNGIGCRCFSAGFQLWLGFREVPHPWPIFFISACRSLLNIAALHSHWGCCSVPMAPSQKCNRRHC